LEVGEGGAGPELVDKEKPTLLGVFLGLPDRPGDDGESLILVLRSLATPPVSTKLA